VTGVIAFWRSHLGELGGLLAQHIALVLASTLVAAAVGVPLGIVAARRPRIGGPVTALAGIVQAIPSLALFGFLLPLPLVGGIGARTAVTALILYALLPIVRTTAAGLQAIDRAVLEAADAMGMSPRQRIIQVELPLALPSIIAGIRVATVVGVGTVTIAAAIGAGGLGEYIYRGLSMVDATVILAGAIPAAALALMADALLLFVQRSLERRRTPLRRSAVVASLCLVMIAGAGVAFAVVPRQQRIVVGS
jgi:osmoprotectant transport system permease protein